MRTVLTNSKYPSGLTRPRALSLSALVWLALCLLLCAVPVAADDSRILVIGGIKGKSGDVNPYLKPMADYIRPMLADLGVENVVVVSAPDREHLAQLIRHGRVDWISQTAYNASYFIQNADVSVLSRGWRGGSPTYKSVFFVREDNALTRLDEVGNHTIAFEHPYSTSAYFVPRMELESMGKTLNLLGVGQRRKSNEGLAYTFSQSEHNTALWVEKGIVDIGVVSDSHWTDANIVPESFRKKLRVLHETDEVVRALELVRGDLDADIKQRLGLILQSMHTDANAENVREAYFKTHRFDKPTEVDIKRLNDFAAYGDTAQIAMQLDDASEGDKTEIGSSGVTQ